MGRTNTTAAWAAGYGLRDVAFYKPAAIEEFCQCIYRLDEKEPPPPEFGDTG